MVSVTIGLSALWSVCADARPGLGLRCSNIQLSSTVVRCFVLDIIITVTSWVACELAHRLPVNDELRFDLLSINTALAIVQVYVLKPFV